MSKHPHLPLLTALVALTLMNPHAAFGWGCQGHQVVAMVAEQYLKPATATKVIELLGNDKLEYVACWADDYRVSHRETAPWHYVDAPLADSQIDLTRECPEGNCVVGKTEEFFTVLRDPSANRTAKAEALKFVVHFIGDLHQPLHDEDNGDKGGNGRRVIFDNRFTNLHELWDIGLIQHISPDSGTLAIRLVQGITPQDRKEWERGTVEDWANEAHQLARTVAYQGLGSETPASITPAYVQAAYPVVKSQLQKAGVRLAWMLNQALR